MKARSAALQSFADELEETARRYRRIARELAGRSPHADPVLITTPPAARSGRRPPAAAPAAARRPPLDAARARRSSVRVRDGDLWRRRLADMNGWGWVPGAGSGADAALVEAGRDALEVRPGGRVALEHERIVPRHDRVGGAARRRSVAQPSTIAPTSNTIGNGRPASKFS